MNYSTNNIHANSVARSVDAAPSYLCATSSEKPRLKLSVCETIYFVEFSPVF